MGVGPLAAAGAVEAAEEQTQGWLDISNTSVELGEGRGCLLTKTVLGAGVGPATGAAGVLW